jgi:hypothetical protein
MMQLTLQDLFNRAYIGVLKQGDVAQDEKGQCFYRTEVDGAIHHCSIGHSMTEHEQVAAGKCNVGYLDTEEEIPSFFSRTNATSDELRELQFVHDKIHQPDKKKRVFLFKTGMERFARQYKLSIPTAEQVAAGNPPLEA